MGFAKSLEMSYMVPVSGLKGNMVMPSPELLTLVDMGGNVDDAKINYIQTA